MYRPETITCVTLQPGDAQIIKALKEEGFNISGLFRKAIRDKYREIKLVEAANLRACP